MKKILSVITLLSCILLTSAITSASTSAVADKGYISVSTSANAELAPDIAEISVAVKTSDTKSMQKAAALNKEISDKVIAALKSMIKTSDGDFIKTSDYSAYPTYSYSGNKRTFDKYEVSNTVVIRTKSIDKTGEIIDKSISLGATNIDNLAFSVSDYEDKCNDLLSIAAQKAQVRAASIAKTLSASVNGVRAIDASCSVNNSYRPQYRMLTANKAMGAADEASSTSIEKGVVKVFANLNASFFVK